MALKDGVRRNIAQVDPAVRNQPLQQPSIPARTMEDHVTGTAMPAATPNTDIPARTMMETPPGSAAGMDVTGDAAALGMPDRSMQEPVSPEMPEREMETR